LVTVTSTGCVALLGIVTTPTVVSVPSFGVMTTPSAPLRPGSVMVHSASATSEGSVWPQPFPRFSTTEVLSKVAPPKVQTTLTVKLLPSPMSAAPPTSSFSTRRAACAP
jgi:hypothetical protein